MDLDKIMLQLEQGWIFSDLEHPTMQRPCYADRLFGVRHILLHQVKAIGRIAEIMERGEHLPGAKVVDWSVAKEATFKMLLNTLRLAVHLEIRESDFAQFFYEWQEEHTPR